ncbi:general secretion pathway protein F [Hydrogenophaga palleronii]|uniref:General secretion pathway protein F n=1 Tax=Hydrogenophaga palleronii TaxID=65655 RepID=A0ABU1WTX7_9BURK|nr:type II secretion system F family protein [Hydrogenophaga palleronii]MDR7152743.1 general secretion pathway protein F [Hydrogenophaga palleronii]
MTTATHAPVPPGTQGTVNGSARAATAQTLVRAKVQAPDGSLQTSEWRGLSEAEVVRKLVARGFRVLALESGATAGAREAPLGRERFALQLFSQELLALLDAGLNLTEALETLLAKERQEAARRVLSDLLQALREGRSFSDVLELMPQHFPQVYVATVRASERTGDLPQALARYIAYQTQFETIRKKLISAAIYPAMLLVVGGFVTLFLLGYVVPRFAVVYESSGRDLPWMSAALLGFGRAIYHHWQIALAGLFAVVGTLGMLVLRPLGRQWLLDQVLRLPFFAHRADEFRLARFYRAVSLLLAAGISLHRAMGMVTGLLSRAQQSRLTQCRLAVEQGQSLSVALIAASLANPVAESLIRVGERSGQMAEMLERTAQFVDDDFARWVDWTSRLLEPVLMTVIGVVIGVVVVLMYLPIFDLAGSLQ